MQVDWEYGRPRITTIEHAGWLSSDDVDVDETLQPDEVVAIAGVERQFGGQRGGGDQQIHRSGAARFAARRDDGREDPAVGASGVSVERQRIEGCFGPLETILTPAPHIGVLCRVRSRGQLSHGDGTYRHLDGQLRRVQFVEIDHHGCVQHAPRRAGRVRHEA
jgi:hypothetical protein